MVQIELRMMMNYGAILCTNGSNMLSGPARIWVKSHTELGMARTIM